MSNHTAASFSRALVFLIEPLTVPLIEGEPLAEWQRSYPHVAGLLQVLVGLPEWREMQDDANIAAPMLIKSSNPNGQRLADTFNEILGRMRAGDADDIAYELFALAVRVQARLDIRPAPPAPEEIMGCAFGCPDVESLPVHIEEALKPAVCEMFLEVLRQPGVYNRRTYPPPMHIRTNLTGDRFFEIRLCNAHHSQVAMLRTDGAENPDPTV